jgi:hypothetical protein
MGDHPSQPQANQPDGGINSNAKQPGRFTAILGIVSAIVTISFAPVSIIQDANTRNVYLICLIPIAAILGIIAGVLHFQQILRYEKDRVRALADEINSIKIDAERQLQNKDAIIVDERAKIETHAIKLVGETTERLERQVTEIERLKLENSKYCEHLEKERKNNLLLRQEHENERDNRKRFRVRHLEIYHMMLHDVRNLAWEWGAASTEDGDTGRVNQVLWRKLVQTVADYTRELFITAFKSQGKEIGEDVHVTLKWKVDRKSAQKIWPELNIDEKFGSDEYKLITLARDSKQPKGREIGEDFYSLTANSAFNHIIHVGQTRGVWASDDIAHLKPYYNENPNYAKQYNSAMAVAIRYHGAESNSGSHFGLFGFLCVDSMNPHRLSLYGNSPEEIETQAFHIASHSADLLALIWRGVNLMMINRRKGAARPDSRGRR